MATEILSVDFPIHVGYGCAHLNPPAFNAYRGSIVHALHDPGRGDDHAIEYIADGILMVAAGMVQEVGPAEELVKRLPSDGEVTDYSGMLIMPGFVDTHVHYPQVDVIASYGAQLLDWLQDYTFPAEARFGDEAVAREAAAFFLDELLRNGTTSALVFASVHPRSVDAVFEAARSRGMRLIAGKVLMDRNCPQDLRDTAESGYEDSKALIEKWHGAGRLCYAITPRFAATSTDRQLARAGRLAREHPDVFVQSHLAENTDEVAWVETLFPNHRSYLDVYDRYGLLRERSVYAHCIHLDERDRVRMGESGAAAAFCPTSNLFLGSGLFDLQAADTHGIRTGIGTDVGGGTTFSILRTLGEGYKVLQLQDQTLTPSRAFYLGTLGGARSLYMDDRIGNFEQGKEADFLVVDPNATPLMTRRMSKAKRIDEKLFALFMLGDDRNIRAVYLAGKKV
ncbi:MAG: Guanine deaminase [Gammaproteobacteria bacterium]|nr:Guanine deaminase [Gammaproteobacteria bacterium]